MSEESKRRIALFEDHEETIRSLKNFLGMLGYEITVEARNMPEAMKVALTLNKLNVLAALVDGNLTQGERGNYEGAKITQVIHENSPGVMVIGYASIGNIEGADFNVGKGERPQILLATLDGIFK